jgi:hypothetical protein
MKQCVHLQMQWPNARLEAACAEIKGYLPEQYELDRAFYERLVSHATVAEDAATVQSLVKLFLLGHLPQGIDVVEVWRHAEDSARGKIWL